MTVYRISLCFQWPALFRTAVVIAVAIAHLQPVLAEPQVTFTSLPGLSKSSQRPRFYDLRNSKNQTCIEALADRKIINGFPDGSFRPHFPVTRAQFAAMISRAFPTARRVRAPKRFVDISPYDWSAEAVQTAYQTGFMSGFPRHRFQPNWGITRAQALVALTSGLNYTPTRTALISLNTTFRDAEAIPRYARPAIAAATEQQLLAYGNNTRLLRPNHLARRSEVAAFLCQALPQQAAQL